MRCSCRLRSPWLHSPWLHPLPMAPPTPHDSTYSPWLHPLPMAPLTMAALAMPGGPDPRLAARGARHPPRCRALRARRAHRARRPRLPRVDAAPRRRRARPRRAAPCAQPPPTACAHLARQLGWGTRPASARLGSGQPPASASLGQLAEARAGRPHRPCLPRTGSARRATLLRLLPALGAKTRQPSFCFSPAGPATDAAAGGGPR